MYRMLSANSATAVQRVLRLPTAASTTQCCCSCGSAVSHNLTQFQKYYQLLYRQAPASKCNYGMLKMCYKLTNYYCVHSNNNYISPYTINNAHTNGRLGAG